MLKKSGFNIYKNAVLYIGMLNRNLAKKVFMKMLNIYASHFSRRIYLKPLLTKDKSDL